MSRARWVARALGVLWLAFGAVVLVMPSRWIPADIVNNDGLAHGFAFAVAVALWVVALPRWGVAVLGVAALLAAGSEVVQGAISPNRDAGWADVFANLSGVAVGAMIGLAVSKAIEGWERWAPSRRRR